jgi:hypothetical protein
MAAQHPTPEDAARRARLRTAFIYVGIVDFILAGFFLGWGASLLGFEYRVAWLVAAVLAASGVVSFFIATLAFGRRGAGRALDDGENADGEDGGPIVRR